MEIGGEGLRKQIRAYAERALAKSNLDLDELDRYVRELLPFKSLSGSESGDLVTELRERSRKGIETAVTFVQGTFREEFEVLAKKGRTEVASLIERFVCLVEERFGISEGVTSTTHNRAEEAEWRRQHIDAVEVQAKSVVRTTDAPKRAPTKKAPAKKAPAKKAGAKRAPTKRAPAKKEGAIKATSKKDAKD